MLRRYAKERQRNCLARPGEQELVLVLDRLKAGFNVAKIFRSAQAFGIREIHLVGIGPFDPAPAKGAFRAVPARFFEDPEASFGDLLERGYRLYCLEPSAGTALAEVAFPSRSAFILGHEEHGLSFEPASHPGIARLGIPQHGVLNSLNVSIAASIAMYEYSRQRRGSGGLAAKNPLETP